MKDRSKALVLHGASIRQTIQAIDKGALQVALVVDDKDRLMGTVTDGDVRRAILAGIDLDESVVKIMNRKPCVVGRNESRDTIRSIMKARSLHQLPIVDQDGILVGMETVDELIQAERRENAVVLMAGGMGRRLKPLTDECPKPLLTVGTKPVLETILTSLIEYGYYNFYVTINYKADMIEEYLGDGSRWGVDITYVRENERMGTAGALSILPRNFAEPILVINGDVLTRINYDHLLNYHAEHRAKATMCIREYDYQIPYGVVKVDKHKLVGIQEKPRSRYFVTAGIYVLEPIILEMIPQNAYLDMPELFEKLIQQKMEPAVFPIREYWLDIGRPDDYEKANMEYNDYFL